MREIIVCINWLNLETIKIPIDVLPAVSCLGFENFAEFLCSFLQIPERCVLILADVADTAPAGEQRVQFLGFRLNQLHEHKQNISIPVSKLWYWQTNTTYLRHQYLHLLQDYFSPGEQLQLISYGVYYNNCHLNKYSESWHYNLVCKKPGFSQKSKLSRWVIAIPVKYFSPTSGYKSLLRAVTKYTVYTRV